METLGEIYNKDKRLVLTPTFLSSYGVSRLLKEINLAQEWEIGEIEKTNNINMNNLLICETGDIILGGVGIITPKNLNHTTATNKARIKRKISLGKFGLLREGDIIIAPVRIYQKKIGVITKSATKFLFSKDFIVLRRKKTNLEESFSLFLSLIQDANIKQLESISTIGKKGYPKIKNKEKILQVKFYKIETPTQKITELIELYDRIYRDIFLKLYSVF
ncbi:MAG: hypothetical protein ABIN73_08130 [candidate division WOR-3 bacterium]